MQMRNWQQCHIYSTAYTKQLRLLRETKKDTNTDVPKATDGFFFRNTVVNTFLYSTLSSSIRQISAQTLASYSNNATAVYRFSISLFVLQFSHRAFVHFTILVTLLAHSLHRTLQSNHDGRLVRVSHPPDSFLLRGSVQNGDWRISADSAVCSRRSYVLKPAIEGTE